MRRMVWLLAIGLGWMLAERAIRERTLPGAAVGDAGHDEWLLDEALAETFPASHPIAPALHATRS